METNKTVGHQNQCKQKQEGEQSARVAAAEDTVLREVGAEELTK